jgi:hypothetical protein
MNVNCPKCETLQSIYNIHCSNCGEKLGEDQKQNSKLKIVSQKVNLLNKLGLSVLNAKDQFVQKLNGLKSKLVFKKKVKTPPAEEIKETVANAEVVVPDQTVEKETKKK